MPAPIVLLNCVGLTPRLLPLALRLSKVGEWVADMPEVLPAVTCTAQATLLTGKLPREHGIVANGWLYRDTMEVRFWQQSNRLIQAEPVYETARKRAKERGKPFKSAKLFWWFNQGAAVDISVTPKPWYGLDGNKVFDIAGTPEGLTDRLKKKHGSFPFAAFWGPMAGIKSTQWIAASSATILEEERPDLTLVYLPHLDYDPQRFGPSGCDMAKCVKELDDACAPLLDAAKKIGANVWIVSEYGHCDVNEVSLPNVQLRKAGLLSVRSGPFGEQLDTINSCAFAVVDHQLAHIYVANEQDVPRVREALEGMTGLNRILSGNDRGELLHERSGELILIAKPNAWFAYDYWLNDSQLPDYAKCIAIHAKPGFDPNELFFDRSRNFPKLHAAWRLLQKKLGFRTLFDVCPSGHGMVRGSHGLAASDPIDRPILVGHGSNPGSSVAMTSFRDLILDALQLS